MVGSVDDKVGMVAPCPSLIAKTRMRNTLQCATDIAISNSML